MCFLAQERDELGIDDCAGGRADTHVLTPILLFSNEWGLLLVVCCSESIPAIWEHINQRRSELRAALETGDASIEQQQLEDACKLLSVVKAAKDISKITSQRVGLDN